MNMGQVLAGDSSTKTFALRNTSVFPVRYEIILNGKMPENYNSLASFLATPEEATILPGEEQIVTVRAQPDVSLPYPHLCEMIVRVPTTNESKSLQYGIHCSARVWPRQLFVRPEDSKNEPSMGSKDLIVDPFVIPVEISGNSSSSSSKEEGGGKVESGGKKERRTIRLTFPKFGLEGNEVVAAAAAAAEATTAEEDPVNNEIGLLCGATAINEEGRAGAGGSFAFKEVDANESSKYFTVTPASVSAKPGEELPIICKFTPPETPAGDDEKVCVIVGQWVEVKYECIMKGGYAPPGVSDEEIVDVVLRGFVVQ